MDINNLYDDHTSILYSSHYQQKEYRYCNAMLKSPNFHISLTRPSYTTTRLLTLALSACSNTNIIRSYIGVSKVVNTLLKRV